MSFLTKRKAVVRCANCESRLSERDRTTSAECPHCNARRNNAGVLPTQAHMEDVPRWFAFWKSPVRSRIEHHRARVNAPHVLITIAIIAVVVVLVIA